MVKVTIQQEYCYCGKDRFFLSCCYNPAKTIQEIVGEINFYIAQNLEQAQKICNLYLNIATDDHILNSLYCEILLASQKYTEAELAFSKLITLIPNDSNIYQQFGFVLKKNGKLNEAEKAFLKSIELDYLNHLSLYHLGALKAASNKHTLAIEYYERALSLYNGYKSLESAIAASYLEIGDYDNSLKYSLEHLEKYKNSHESYNNAGLAYMHKKEFQKAKEYLEKASELDNNNLTYLINYGNLLLNIKEHQKAVTAFKMALEQKPKTAQDLEFKLDYLFFLNRYEELINFVKENSVSSLTKQGQEKFIFYQLIISYLQENYDYCTNLLKLHYEIFKEEICSIWYQVYIEYITKLIQHNQHNQSKYHNNYDDNLYIIGESHSLSPANMVINWQDKKYKLKANFIVGAKIWHLIAKDTGYIQKISFIDHIQKLPDSSILIAAFGEIDCRIDQGIISYIQKNAHLDMKEYISSMANEYIKFLLETTKGKTIRLIIQGIPKPNIKFDNDQDKELLIEIITSFNQSLKDGTRTAKIGFLDVYSYTANAGGVANNLHHIDNYHLYPDYLENCLININQGC